ncbi:MAG: hydrogenase nickel incorporation protein HypB [Candidatus Thorarchaeota archaeon]
MPEKETSLIIELNEDLIANNDNLAEQNSTILKELKIKSIDFVGAIGAGKTAIIESIVQQISKEYNVLVVNGDVTTRVDADRIEKHGVNTIQINTGRECALNSYHISQVLKNYDLNQINLLFIENVGNLICPSDFILGTDKRVAIVSITEGEWVIKKHPLLFKSSDVAVINKIDLLDVMDINLEEMVADAKKINPNIDVIPTSATTGKNISKLISALDI